MTTATQTKERPILFSGAMVQAILDGRKTMTRRIVKPRMGGLAGLGFFGLEGDTRNGIFAIFGDIQHPRKQIVHCPYGQPGDHLWVRETWCAAASEGYDAAPRDGRPYDDVPHPCWYRATDAGQIDEWSEGSPWRPSIHMPRWASRITLEITDARVERLHEISEHDAEREGVSADMYIEQGFMVGSLPAQIDRKAHNAREAFQYLWGKINGAGSWDANPWVWVVSFRVIR